MLSSNYSLLLLALSMLKALALAQQTPLPADPALVWQSAGQSMLMLSSIYVVAMQNCRCPCWVSMLVSSTVCRSPTLHVGFPQQSVANRNMSNINSMKFERNLNSMTMLLGGPYWWSMTGNQGQISLGKPWQHKKYQRRDVRLETLPSIERLTYETHTRIR